MTVGIGVMTMGTGVMTMDTGMGMSTGPCVGTIKGVVRVTVTARSGSVLSGCTGGSGATRGDFTRGYRSREGGESEGNNDFKLHITFF